MALYMLFVSLALKWVHFYIIQKLGGKKFGFTHFHGKRFEMSFICTLDVKNEIVQSKPIPYEGSVCHNFFHIQEKQDHLLH